MSSRVHNAFLGGNDAYAIDRAAAAQVRRLAPSLEVSARVSRAFMRRAVSLLAGSGVDQFIDIGCGYPTTRNVHEVAQRGNPGARVVYTDNDTGVLVHARALLGGYPGVGVAFADAGDVHELLTHPMLRRLIDMQRPVAVLMVHLLEFLDDPRAERLLNTLRSTLPLGSHLVVTHMTADLLTGDARDELVAGASLYSGLVAPFRLRSVSTVNEWLGDCALLPPGVCRADAWRRIDGGGDASDDGPKGLDAPVVVAVGRLVDHTGGFRR